MFPLHSFPIFWYILMLPFEITNWLRTNHSFCIFDPRKPIHHCSARCTMPEIPRAFWIWLVFRFHSVKAWADLGTGAGSNTSAWFWKAPCPRLPVTLRSSALYRQPGFTTKLGMIHHDSSVGCLQQVIIWYTLWLFNIAMENGPFTDDFPIKASIYKGFSIAMLNNQRVSY